MSALFIVLPLALIVAAVAVGAYIWAARSGQLDDLETPAHRILNDDDEDVAGHRDANREEPPRSGA